MSTKFVCSDVKTAKVSDLNANDFFIKYGLDVLDPKQLAEYQNLLEYFGVFEIPVVMVDKKGDTSVLSNWKDVKAAQEMGKDKIEVREISIADGTEISQADIVRFINFKNYFGNTKDYLPMYGVLKELEAAHDKKEAWIADLPGDKHDKLASVTGYGTTQVKKILKVGNTDIRTLNDIKEDKVSLNKAYETLLENERAAKNALLEIEGSKKKLNNLPSVNSSPRPAQTLDQPSFDLAEVQALIAAINIDISGPMPVLINPVSSKLKLEVHYAETDGTKSFILEENKMESDVEINRQFRVQIQFKGLNRIK